MRINSAKSSVARTLSCSSLRNKLKFGLQNDWLTHYFYKISRAALKYKSIVIMSAAASVSGPEAIFDSSLIA